MRVNSFGSPAELTGGDGTFEMLRLDRVQGSDRLPNSGEVLLRSDLGPSLAPERA